MNNVNCSFHAGASIILMVLPWQRISSHTTIFGTSRRAIRQSSEISIFRTVLSVSIMTKFPGGSHLSNLTHITAQLNAAKGNLRTVIHRRLYGPIKHLLGTRCKCKAETLWGYEKALYDTGAWPLEEVGKGHSMHDIMNRLGKFKYKVAETACMFPCHQNFERIVEDAVTYTAQNFNGLCLDCMDRMKPKTGDRHDDYWRHNNFRDRDVWFKGCRIKHKQPTWYFSFMGSQEDKDYLQSKDKRPYESDSDSDRYP